MAATRSQRFMADLARNGRFVIVDTDRHNLPYVDVGFATHEEAEHERIVILKYFPMGHAWRKRLVVVQRAGAKTKASKGIAAP